MASFQVGLTNAVVLLLAASLNVVLQKKNEVGGGLRLSFSFHFLTVEIFSRPEKRPAPPSFPHKKELESYSFFFFFPALTQRTGLDGILNQTV